MSRIPNEPVFPADACPTVLVVDDEDHIRRALHFLLSRDLSCRLLEARNGREALGVIETERIHLIISDVMMPQVDGLELCRRIRESESLRDIYLILLTAKAEADDRISGLNTGADDYVPKPFNQKELLARVKAGLRIVELQEELKRKNRILHRLSITDGLTGSYNHSFFERALEEEFERTRRYQRPLSLILCDIDDFKHFNDTYGHQTGDAVLSHVARLLTTRTRINDVVARYGGEEFAILIPETSLANAHQVADKIRDEVARFGPVVDGKPLAVTISVGVACFDGTNHPSRTAFFEAADQALYRAKRAGKNCVVAG